MIYPWLQTIWKTVVAQRGRTHHALLIHGPAGIGKSDFAAELTRAWLCEAPLPDGSACLDCASCGWVTNGHHPDSRLLAPGSDAEDGDGEGTAKAARAKASTDIRIDQVRALERFVAVGGHRGGVKVVRIDPADAMNTAAANALLKTLEEPGERTRFLLVTHRPDVLPPTIRSRCLAISLPVPDSHIAVEWLAADAEIDSQRAQEWLAAAGGSPLRARRFADPATASTHRLVMETFSSLPETAVVRAADALAGIEPSVWVPVLQSWVADLQRSCIGAPPRRFPERADRLHSLAHRTSLGALDRLAGELTQFARAVDHPLNPRLAIEDALIRLHRALAG